MEDSESTSSKDKVPDLISEHYGSYDEIEGYYNKEKAYGYANTCPACEEDSIEPGTKLCFTCNDKVRNRICTVCNDPIIKPGKPLAGSDYLGRCINCSNVNYCSNCGMSPIQSGKMYCLDCKRDDDLHDHGIR
jgi:hypothetical protein